MMDANSYLEGNARFLVRKVKHCIAMKERSKRFLYSRFPRGKLKFVLKCNELLYSHKASTEAKDISQ
jgi:hypothetical protein